MDHVCIHGHFYQPPRENPWTEAVPNQPSALPFHDWNRRITEECYRRAGAARIQDDAGRTLAVLNTFARISFDIGPTLLTWLDAHAPEVRDAMIDGDRAAVAEHGHGTAIAQAYSHVILPLATQRDRQTQIRWALRDFEARFSRPSEGLWLPECAVDTPTLEDAAREGVRFVILAPGQLSACRPPGGTWDEEVDPRRPYRIALPSGASIAAFVYDGGIAHALAFGRLLDSGDALYDQLREAARGGGLAHTATDGESYGHHHRKGEMALAWALHRLERDPTVRVVPYGRYLADHPPTWEGRLAEDSSWSCAHGIERWRSDCGCGTAPGGGHWRAPLRTALDRLAARLDALFERSVPADDAWALRDAYIEVLLGAEPHPWLEAQLGRPLSAAEAERVLTALEMQRQRLLMFASCGWFFDDLAGIEPVQDLVFAWRALELAARLEPETEWIAPLREDLAKAHSNDPEAGTGTDLLDRRVKPVFVGLAQAASRAAVEGAGSPAHDMDIEDFGVSETGWIVERITVRERRTGHAQSLLRARHPELGLAGTDRTRTSVPALITALDADPEAWRRELRACVRRPDRPWTPDGVRPEWRERLTRLGSATAREVLEVLDHAARTRLRPAERYELTSAMVRRLGQANTHDPRWAGIRTRAAAQLDLGPGLQGERAG